MYLFLYREEVHIQLKMEGKIALVWRDKNVLKKENPDGHLITQMQKHGLVAPFQNHVDYLKVEYIYQDSKTTLQMFTGVYRVPIGFPKEYK